MREELIRKLARETVWSESTVRDIASHLEALHPDDPELVDNLLPLHLQSKTYSLMLRNCEQVLKSA